MERDKRTVEERQKVRFGLEHGAAHLVWVILEFENKESRHDLVTCRTAVVMSTQDQVDGFAYVGFSLGIALYDREFRLPSCKRLRIAAAGCLRRRMLSDSPKRRLGDVICVTVSKRGEPASMV
jgi:hypothetical protein